MDAWIHKLEWAKRGYFQKLENLVLLVKKSIEEVVFVPPDWVNVLLIV